MFKKALKTCLVLMICFLSTAFVFGCDAMPSSNVGTMTISFKDTTTEAEFSCTKNQSLRDALITCEMKITYSLPSNVKEEQKNNYPKALTGAGYDDASASGVVFVGFDSSTVGGPYSLTVRYGICSTTIKYMVTE